MFTPSQFIDRAEAGHRLAEALAPHSTDRPLIVLGLPRGGVPVAAAIAESLDAPLDTFIVRKLGVPGQEELAMGAIASGGVRVLNEDIVYSIGISPEEIDEVTAAETEELHRREALYRGDRPFPALAGETVIVVDDGAATGASMRAAIVALRQLGPKSIIAALPVASLEALSLLRTAANECACLIAPEPFYGVGMWYRDFTQTTDEEVRRLLAEGRRPEASAAI